MRTIHDVVDDFMATLPGGGSTAIENSHQVFAESATIRPRYPLSCLVELEEMESTAAQNTSDRFSESNTFVSKLYLPQASTYSTDY